MARPRAEAHAAVLLIESDDSERERVSALLRREGYDVTKSRVRIHPLQYVLVGVAVALFFLVLLAVSEFVAFPIAYAAAAGACTLLVSLYSLSVLKTQRRTLVAAGGLSGAFAFLYVVLQLEDYALLLGSIGLLAALAAVMYATRGIDWYARDGVTSPTGPLPGPCSPSPPSGAALP